MIEYKWLKRTLLINGRRVNNNGNGEGGSGVGGKKEGEKVWRERERALSLTQQYPGSQPEGLQQSGKHYS